jgi:hypothetical protein
MEAAANVLSAKADAGFACESTIKVFPVQFEPEKL